MTEWLLDPDGNQIDVITWSSLRMDRSKFVVAQHEIPLPNGETGWLRTLWVGTVPGCGCHDNFGTTVWTNRLKFVCDLEPYRTKQQAIEGHWRHLNNIRTGGGR